jgi:hypothetical protein
VDDRHYHGAVTPQDRTPPSRTPPGRTPPETAKAPTETNRRWLIGVLIAVAGIIIPTVATLIAAGKLPCPVCGDSPPATSTPAPGPVGPPSFTITPAQGTLPLGLTVTLTGFGANEFVTIIVNEAKIASPQTDATGAVRGFTINLSATVAGNAHDLTLFARGQTSGTERTATFHVVTG